jgi:hypothetical protein
VKYVVARDDLLASDRIDEIVATASMRGRSGRVRFPVAGTERDVFVQAPPADAVFEVEVPARDPVLRLAPVLHPRSWSRGDAVELEVDVAFGGHAERVFLRKIEPRGDQPWEDVAIDLARWAGKRIVIRLATRTTAPDVIAGWGGVRLVSPWEGLRSVYEGADARIYENTEVLPRAFVVQQARVVDGEKAALDALADPAFDPRTTVLLEGGEALEGSASVSSATVVARSANSLVVECETAARGYLVVLDAWYAGWKARVDNVERPILRADDLFRAVALEPGRHRVEFVFRPTSFSLGVMLSALGAALVALCFFLGRSFTSAPAS